MPGESASERVLDPVLPILLSTEVEGGFVQQQDRRVTHQCASERYALALTSGKATAMRTDRALS